MRVRRLLPAATLVAAALVTGHLSTVHAAAPDSAAPRTAATAPSYATAAAAASSTVTARKSAPGKAKNNKKRKIVEYVALGDSWSADTLLLDQRGLPDKTHAPIDCGQSKVNYPKLLAKKLGVKRFRDATCGSATTEHFRNPQTGLPIGGTNPPQFDRLTKRTDLVTIGIGGNDAGVAASAFDCLSVLPMVLPGTAAFPELPPLPLPLVGTKLPLGGCEAYYTDGGVDLIAEAVKASLPKVVRAIKDVKKRSPKARIILVDYLAAVPPTGCWPLVPITDDDMAYLHKNFLRLNKMLRKAAKKTKIELADTYTPTLGHDVCQGPKVRYAEALGLSFNDIAVVIPAHPNAAGARAQYRAVLKQVRRGR